MAPNAQQGGERQTQSREGRRMHSAEDGGRTAQRTADTQRRDTQRRGRRTHSAEKQAHSSREAGAQQRSGRVRELREANTQREQTHDGEATTATTVTSEATTVNAPRDEQTRSREAGRTAGADTRRGDRQPHGGEVTAEAARGTMHGGAARRQHNSDTARRRNAGKKKIRIP